MAEREIGCDHRVEPFAEIEAGHIAALKSESGGQVGPGRPQLGLGLGQHGGGKVDAQHLDPARGERETHATRAGAELQDRAPRRRQRGIEVDIARQAGVRRGGQVVEPRRQALLGIVGSRLDPA